MTNKKKKEYINNLIELNVKDYMNGNKNNTIGRIKLEFRMLALTITLRIKKELKFSYSQYTHNDWSK